MCPGWLGWRLWLLICSVVVWGLWGVVVMVQGKVAEAEAALTALGVEALGLFGDVCVEEKCDATVAAVVCGVAWLSAVLCFAVPCPAS